VKKHNQLLVSLSAEIIADNNISLKNERHLWRQQNEFGKRKIGFIAWGMRQNIVFDSSVAILAYYYTDLYGLPLRYGDHVSAGSVIRCDNRPDNGNRCGCHVNTLGVFARGCWPFAFLLR
jgi:hypothetical protein